MLEMYPGSQTEHTKGPVVEETVKVFCRLRPRVPDDEDNGDEGDSEAGMLTSAFVTPEVDSSRDDVMGCIENFTEDGEVRYHRPHSANIGDGAAKEFRFTGFLPPNSSQEEVYKRSASEVVSGVTNGYNGTIIAYGQTGSGKTYTMRGDDEPAAGRNESQSVGIIHRAIEQIFESARQREQTMSTEVTVSYVQIYCEIIMDLLGNDNSSSSVLIRERKGEVYVEGAVEVEVHSARDCMEILRRGDQRRITAATRLNAASSRSHAALLVRVQRRARGTDAALLRSTLVLVDLAGSERAKASGALGRHTQFQELRAINLSLSALGNCVAALAAGRPHVPYRDSKLTRLLQQSLGGNARTSVIVNIRPGDDESGETLGSLQFAQRALAVKVQASLNQQVDYEELCRALQEQLDRREEDHQRLGIDKANLEKQLEEANDAVEQLKEEASRAKAMLQAAEEGYKTSLQAIQSASGGDDPGGERAIAAIESVNAKWREEMEKLRDEHRAETAELRGRLEDRALAYKAAAHRSDQAWNEADLELSQEREGHLQALRELRACRAALAEAEARAAERGGQVHEELALRTRQAEELQAALDEVAAQGLSGAGKAQELQERLVALEKQHSSQANDLAENYVSRESVEMMEKLFMDTIERLNDRVQDLERSKGAVAGAPARGDMDRGSRRLLDELERGNPVVAAARRQSQGGAAAAPAPYGAAGAAAGGAAAAAARIQPGGRVMPRNNTVPAVPRNARMPPSAAAALYQQQVGGGTARNSRQPTSTRKVW